MKQWPDARPTKKRRDEIEAWPFALFSAVAKSNSSNVLDVGWRTPMACHSEDELEPGSPCPSLGCAGHLDVAPPQNCSCHMSAPCSACENSGLACSVCDFDSTPYRGEYDDYEPPVAKVDRSGMLTSTRTANPFNSTPFTACCGFAAINKDRCPNCNAKITHHDDGLAVRRREVGPDNCLMCGKKRGELGIFGNCCC